MSPTTAQPSSTSRREAGFTWSEFALVAFLVSLLVLAASWGIGGIREQTNESFCESSLRSLKLAVGEYEAANDRLPVDNQSLVDGGYANADDITGHNVTVEPGATEPAYTPKGRCA